MGDLREDTVLAHMAERLLVLGEPTSASCSLLGNFLLPKILIAKWGGEETGEGALGALSMRELTEKGLMPGLWLRPRGSDCSQRVS